MWGGAHILQCFLIGDVKNESEQIRKLRLNLSGSEDKGYSQHLQYLDSRKSSAKDLSLPKFEIEISHNTFNGKSGSYATRSRPNACHVTVDAVYNTA